MYFQDKRVLAAMCLVFTLAFSAVVAVMLKAMPLIGGTSVLSHVLRVLTLPKLPLSSFLQESTLAELSACLLASLTFSLSTGSP